MAEVARAVAEEVRHLAREEIGVEITAD